MNVNISTNDDGTTRVQFDGKDAADLIRSLTIVVTPGGEPNEIVVTPLGVAKIDDPTVAVEDTDFYVRIASEKIARLRELGVSL